jgi:hypothetical protein
MSAGHLRTRYCNCETNAIFCAAGRFVGVVATQDLKGVLIRAMSGDLRGQLLGVIMLSGEPSLLITVSASVSCKYTAVLGIDVSPRAKV